MDQPLPGRGLLDDGQEEVFSAAEVGIDGTRRKPRTGGDLRDRCGVETALGEWQWGRSDVDLSCSNPFDHSLTANCPGLLTRTAF